MDVRLVVRGFLSKSSVGLPEVLGYLWRVWYARIPGVYTGATDDSDPVSEIQILINILRLVKTDLETAGRSWPSVVK